MELLPEDPLEIRFFFHHGAASVILSSMIVAIGTLCASMSVTKRHVDDQKIHNKAAKKPKLSPSGTGNCKVPPSSDNKASEDRTVELNNAKVSFTSTYTRGVGTF